MSGMARARLGANECPLPPAPQVLAAIAAAGPEASRYPDPRAEHALRERLARAHGVAAAQIALGNGASELIDLVLAAFTAPSPSAPDRGEIVICEPTFPLFRLRGEHFGVRITRIVNHGPLTESDA